MYSNYSSKIFEIEDNLNTIRYMMRHLKNWNINKECNKFRYCFSWYEKFKFQNHHSNTYLSTVYKIKFIIKDSHN